MIKLLEGKNVIITGTCFEYGDYEGEITEQFIVKPITKYSVMIKDPYMIKYHLEKAIHIATNGRPGPVWLDIPANIQNYNINGTGRVAVVSASVNAEFNCVKSQ